jgi:hypothetical protein
MTAAAAGAAASEAQPEAVVPRWWTKLFSLRCIAQVLRVVANSADVNAAHWDLALARVSTLLMIVPMPMLHFASSL